MFCLFTGIFCSVDEVILNGERYTVILKKSQIRIFAPLCFHLTTGKMANAIARQKKNLEIQKKRGQIYWVKLFILVWKLSRDPVPFFAFFSQWNLSLSYFWPDPSQESIFTNNFYLFLLLDGKRVCVPSPKYTQDRQQLYLYKYFHPPWVRRHSE